MREKSSTGEEGTRQRAWRPLLCRGWPSTPAAGAGLPRCRGGSGASSPCFCCWKAPAASPARAAPRVSTSTTTLVSTFTWASRRWRSFLVRRPVLYAQLSSNDGNVFCLKPSARVLMLCKTFYQIHCSAILKTLACIIEMETSKSALSFRRYFDTPNLKTLKAIYYLSEH